MLSFEDKLAICSAFPELERRDVSLKRVNFHYEDSAYDKKTVVYHLHPNGNGYVYGGRLPGAETDDKGWINIRDYSADELRQVIAESIRSLTGDTSHAAPLPAKATARETRERWTDPDGSTLTLHYEEELWYVFAGENLDGAFETREEAVEYLEEEGFTPD